MKIPIVVALTLFLTQAQIPKGVIEGRVIRAGSNEPISDVLVTLMAPLPANATSNLPPDVSERLSAQISELTLTGNLGGASQAVIDSTIDNLRRNAGAATSRPVTAMTDGDGHFSFRDLAPGRYTVRAEKEGYFATPLNGTAPTAVTKTIILQDGKPSPPEDLRMVKSSVISGRIRDPNGQAISAMNVSAYRVTYSNGRKMWTAMITKPTDDRGEYRIYGLSPGEYFVGVTPRTPGPTPGPQDSWARTFFPGTIEPAAATPVEIRDGVEVSGTDINIQTVAAASFKISGVVINSAARPNPATGAIDRSIGSFVLSPREPGVLDSLNPPTIGNMIPVASRTNGEFELRNIRPGSYDLYPVAPVITDTVASSGVVAVSGPTASPQLANITTGQVINGTVTIANGARGGAAITRRQPTSRTAVEVNQDIKDLRIVVSDGVPLSGEIHLNGTVDRAFRYESIRLNLRNLDTMPASFVGLIGTIPVDSNGRFSVANVPEAQYTFQVAGLPSTAYVADIRQGSSSVFDSGFVLDSAATPIQVLVETNGVTVQGIVLNADGNAAPNATVVLVPPVSRRQNSMLYRNATSDATGSFVLKGVPPGPYTIFAWESVLPTAWQNAEFIAKYEGRGKQFNVSAGSVAEVQLNIIP